jgi:hypothetical protein
VQIQYLGFQQKSGGRDYSFRVQAAKVEAREFVFTITNEEFAERLVRYQDAPDICYRRLQRALAEETAEQPLPRHARVSNQELEEYREKHRVNRKRSW